MAELSRIDARRKDREKKKQDLQKLISQVGSARRTTAGKPHSYALFILLSG